MKITVCYEEGHTPGSTKCKVYGFDVAQYKVDNGWVVYSIYEIEGEPNLADFVVDYIKQYGVEYSDKSFASIVPESANVVSSIVDMILARHEFSGIPYDSYTRQRGADKWTEISRRYIMDEDFKVP